MYYFKQETVLSSPDSHVYQCKQSKQSYVSTTVYYNATLERLISQTVQNVLKRCPNRENDQPQ